LGLLNRKIALFACFWACSPAISWQPKTNPPTTSSPTHQLPLSVNGSTCSLYPQTSPNKACTTLTICDSNGFNCITLSDLRVDTYTSGIRVFRNTLPSNLYNSLRSISTINGNLATCFLYEGVSYWGNVFQATLLLDGEQVSVPIQIIDKTQINPTNANATNLCTSLTNTPATSNAAHFQGILGMGPRQRDCGTPCASQASPYYYSCRNGLPSSSTSCTQSTVPTNQQLTNPFTQLSSNANGVILKLPSVTTGGIASLEGSLLLGIDTQSNNVSTGASTIPVDANNLISIQPQGNSYSAMINAATSAFVFPSTMASTSVNQISYYCPTTNPSFTSMIYGSSNITLSFPIGNATSLLGGSSYVFSELGIASSKGPIIYGIPFFFGKSVFVGFENTSSSLGAGPYYAF